MQRRLNGQVDYNIYNPRIGGAAISKFSRTLIRIEGLPVQVKARLAIIFDEKL